MKNSIKTIEVLSVLVLLNVCLSASEMITRSDWQAMPASDGLTNQELPAKRVIISHTATNNCETKDVCMPIIRNIQKYHMESSQFSDIGYNFLIGGDGNTYEGRGWDFIGAHTGGHNTGSIGIAFIGMFDKSPPNDNQLNAAKKLMKDPGKNLNQNKS